MEGANDSAHIALHQNDVGAFDGDVGSGAHGNADVGGGQCRRVIDSVARHGNYVVSGTVGSHALVLVVRLDASLDLFDSKLFGDSFCCAFVVAGKHDNVHVESLQLFDGRRGR